MGSGSGPAVVLLERCEPHQPLAFGETTFSPPRCRPATCTRSSSTLCAATSTVVAGGCPSFRAARVRAHRASPRRLPGGARRRPRPTRGHRSAGHARGHRHPVAHRVEVRRAAAFGISTGTRARCSRTCWVSSRPRCTWASWTSRSPASSASTVARSIRSRFRVARVGRRQRERRGRRGHQQRSRPLDLASRPVSPGADEFPLITGAQRDGDLATAAAVERWRTGGLLGRAGLARGGAAGASCDDPIETVILPARLDAAHAPRDGRRELLTWGFERRGRVVPGGTSHAWTLLEHFVSVHDVEGVAPGAYRWQGDRLQPRRQGQQRDLAAHLCFDQPLGGDSPTPCSTRAISTTCSARSAGAATAPLSSKRASQPAGSRSPRSRSATAPPASPSTTKQSRSTSRRKQRACSSRRSECPTIATPRRPPRRAHRAGTLPAAHGTPQPATAPSPLLEAGSEWIKRRRA